MAIEVKAKLSYLRISPRKVRLVANLVRGKKAVSAVATLSLLSKKVAKPLKKLIESAMANAKNKYELAGENLRIVKITVDEGPILKRWMPRARGRATTIRKRTSHIKLTLAAITEPAEPKTTDKKKKILSKKNDVNKKQADKTKASQVIKKNIRESEVSKKQTNK